MCTHGICPTTNLETHFWNCAEAVRIARSGVGPEVMARFGTDCAGVATGSSNLQIVELQLGLVKACSANLQRSNTKMYSLGQVILAARSAIVQRSQKMDYTDRQLLNVKIRLCII